MKKSVYSKIITPSGLIFLFSLSASIAVLVTSVLLFINLFDGAATSPDRTVLAGALIAISALLVSLVSFGAGKWIMLRKFITSLEQHYSDKEALSFLENQSGEQGRIARTFGRLVRDYEDREQQFIEASSQLQECKSQYRAISECSEIGIWHYTFEGKTLYANPTMLKFMQADDISQLEKLPVYNFFSSKDKGCLSKFNQIVEGGVPVSFEIEMTGLSNKRRFLLVSSSPVVLENGKAQSIISVFVDISDRKRAEIQLRDSRDTLEKYSRRLESVNAELESFSYSISHDLKAPLMHIDGYANLLRTEVHSHLNEQEKHYIDRIVCNSEYMQKMIKGILDLSRANTALLNKENVNLSSLAKLVCLDFKKNHPDMVFSFDVESDIVASCDYYLMRTVLENLIGNALKYSSKEELIKIEFAAIDGNENSITLMVRDNGIGFDMEQKEKLFLPFQRLHDSVEIQGTGIGLTSVKKIIERHGGSIWAESEKGKGATFFFTLEN